MSHPLVPEVTTETFSAEVLESARPVAVKFFGDACRPCEVFAPVVESLAGEFAGRVEFRAVNVRENVQLGVQYRVDSVPRTIFFLRGKPVGELRGLAARPIVLRRLEELLAAAG